MAKSDRALAALRNPSYLRVANIIGISNLNSNNDVDAIEDYIRKNGDPYENQLAAANKALTDIRAKSVEDLRSLTQTFESRIADMNAGFDRRYTNLQQSATARYNKLNDVLISQQQDFATQRTALQGQLQAAQDINAEQTRIAAAQANAYVPDANPSAMSAAAGDDRQDMNNSAQKRRAEDNTLSNLAVLTGLGTQANPLSGLQIA